jgi:hypothetical protein
MTSNSSDKGSDYKQSSSELQMLISIALLTSCLKSSSVTERFYKTKEYTYVGVILPYIL